MKKILLYPILCILFCFSSCGKKKPKERLTIVATTTMIADAIKNIVGKNLDSEDKNKRVILVTLMGPGVDPHAYKATHRDIQQLSSANLVFYNGLHLEGKMADILQSNSENKKPFYAVSDGIDSSKLLRDAKFDVVGVDPHIWFDVTLWIDCVIYMCAVLKKLDPHNAENYEKNTQEYVKQLNALHEFTYITLQQIPSIQKVLISAHDAFSYFGRAYHIEVKGLQGISTVSECGLKDVSDMTNLIMTRNVKAIFLETSVPEGPIRAVVEGCVKRGYNLKIGGYLFSDALGSMDTPQGTYIGMVQANVKTLVESLA